MLIEIFLGNSKSGKVTWIPKKEKNPHLLVVGTSGSGKTETVKSVVYELNKQKIPSLIIDFHDDFDELAANKLDFTNTTINPLDFSGGETAEAVMYKVSGILRKIFNLGVQQEGALQNAIMKCYQEKGIGLKDIKHEGELPTFEDIKDELEMKESELDAMGKGSVVIRTLLVRLRPLFDTGFFNEKETMDFSKVFKKTTVLKLKSLPTDEVKYAVAEFFINKLKYALYERGKSKKLILYCIVDEAHRLIDERSPLNDLLRESRKYGTGVVLSSQRPGDFSETVLANIGGVVALQCRFEKDARFIAKQMGIEFTDIQNLTEIGTAYVNFSSSANYEKVKIVSFEQRYKGKVKVKEVGASKDKKKIDSKSVKGQNKIGERGMLKNKEGRSKTENSSLFHNEITYQPEYHKPFIHSNNPVRWFVNGCRKIWLGMDFLTEQRKWKILTWLFIVFALYWFVNLWTIPLIVAFIVLVGSI
jgi:hypothetical protein